MKKDAIITNITFFGLPLVAILGIVVLLFEIVSFSNYNKDVFYFIITLIFLIIVICCIILIMLQIIIPLGKILILISKFKKTTLLDNKNSIDILSQNKFGIIGIVIEEMLKIISKEPKARMLNAEVALYALQNQINPHFLYNTLDTIRNYSMKYEVTEVADMIQSLSSIFRYSISRPGEVASLCDEINNVKDYLKIQWYRFSDRFNVLWEIDDVNDEILKYSLPVLTLQPLVENAIQHGLENNLESGMITIRATTTQSKLIVSIEDNGCGIPSERLNIIRDSLENDLYITEYTNRLSDSMKKTGITLVNLNQRLKLYFGDEGRLSINSIEGFGTNVELEVPKI
jgi:two-component system sensor histidine kinase YesM